MAVETPDARDLNTHAHTRTHTHLWCLQAWFMEGKEGKEYKPNSLHQIMRRLGFFPTMRSSRAGTPKTPDLVLL